MTSMLDAAISGLRVSQEALNVISTNISNASTVGYTRKILPQESVIIDGKSVGAATTAITRTVSNSLLIAERQQTSTAAYYSTTSDYLNQVMDFIGASENETAISLELGDLEEAFVSLSADPSNAELLEDVLSQAETVALSFNEYSDLLNDLRSQTESDVISAVDEINAALESIAKLNKQINEVAISGQGTADLEDQRDIALKTLTEYMDVNTYYDGNKLIVITKSGVTLADVDARTVSFQQSSMTPSKYYPGGGLNGLLVDGTDITGDISEGKLGALFELRDETLPQYQAQLDELAQKISSRLDAEGLTLFTDTLGNVPADGSNYSGYASKIQVNSQIVDDPTLLRNGTTGNTEAVGSNEVINRVIEYAFGSYSYQQLEGSVDISAGTLATTLGITVNNRVTGDVNLASFPDFSTFTNVAEFPADIDITCGTTTETITVEEDDTASSLAAKINLAFGSSVASINSEGALALNYDGDITIASNLADPLSDAALAELGLTYDTYDMPNATITVQVGTQNATTIEIEDTDTAADLLAKLNAISGVSASLNADGELVIIPSEGGSLSVLDETGSALSLMGAVTTNIEHSSFSQTGLGASGSLETGLNSSGSILSYASSMISYQSNAANTAESVAEQEENYLATLEEKNANISGVNIDEELSEMIRIQAVYSAAAKMISKIEELLDTLLNSI